MNTHEPNSSELNGESVHSALINLGPVSAELGLFMYEVDGSPMSGTTGIDFQTFGNLSRVIQLGSGVAGLNFAVTGGLIRDPHVLLGAVSSTFNFSVSGSMYVKSLIGKSSTGIAFTSSAAINNSVQLIGNTSIAFGVSGALTQYVKKALPAAAASINLDISGSLASYVSMGAVEATITFDITGLLATLIYISGNTGITFDVSGSLFNNPTADDPDGYTLTRPFVDRLLVRRS